MDEWKRDRIGAAERGENPMVLARMPSGFAVIGDTQFLPGYCVLLASPAISHLSELSFDRRRQFLFDMSLLGEAIERHCHNDGLRRINYEILGNIDTYLHAHVFPRYDWEPADRIGYPVWLYPEMMWTDAAHAFTLAKHATLKVGIQQELLRLMEQAE